MSGPSSIPLPRSNPAWRIGIVHAAVHGDVVAELVRGAREILEQAGIPRGNIRLHEAAGSFEIPLIGAALLATKDVEGLIGLGVIVEGETHHAELIAREVARAVSDLQVRTLKPFAFEVLYVADLAQARARAGREVNRGADAARAVLHSLAQLETIR